MRIRLYHLRLLCNVPLKWLLASYLYSSHRQEFQWCPHGLFVLWRLYTIKEEVLPQTQMKVCLLAHLSQTFLYSYCPQIVAKQVLWHFQFSILLSNKEENVVVTSYLLTQTSILPGMKNTQVFHYFQ